MGKYSVIGHAPFTGEVKVRSPYPPHDDRPYRKIHSPSGVKYEYYRSQYSDVEPFSDITTDEQQR